MGIRYSQGESLIQEEGGLSSEGGIALLLGGGIMLADVLLPEPL